MDFGSIFTSSARGSCSLRPMEIAPRMVRSKSGNSSRAISPAEYTEAPSSSTTVNATAECVSLIMEAISSCTAWEPVPFPTATS